MKIFRRLKNWLFPSKPITSMQLADLLDVTIRCIITEDFHLILDENKICINAWIGNNYCPISFEIIELHKHKNSASTFVNYIKLKLRKAGIEL